MKKKCTGCEKSLPIGEFTKWWWAKDGRSPRCQRCQKESGAARRKTLHGWSVGAIAHCRARAKARGVPCTINASYLEQIFPKDFCCPALHFKLQLGGRRNGTSASVDEVVPGLGYVPGNVIVVSSKVNVCKSNLTIQELTAVTEFYTRLK